MKNKPVRQKKFNIQKLTDADTREIYKIKIGGRFEPLLNIPDTDLEVEDLWDKIKDSFQETSQEVLGFKKPKPQKPWLTTEVLELCDERREVKQQKLTDKIKNSHYNFLNREIKRKSKKCKDSWLKNLCKEVEECHQASKTRQVYQTIKTLTGKQTLRMKSIKDKDGNVLTEEERIRDRWKENYADLYNMPGPSDTSIIQTIPSTQTEDTEPDILKEEVATALKHLKEGKELVLMESLLKK